MCRPSCCNHSGGQGAGIAAVAIIGAAALAAAKIGPIVTRIVHTLVEVIRLAALTTGLVLALAAVTWTAIVITRWQLQRRTELAAHQTRVVMSPTIRMPASQASYPADCLACGGTGTVLRAIGSGRYQSAECPVCEPSTRAG
jgi:hypothetical protein